MQGDVNGQMNGGRTIYVLNDPADFYISFANRPGERSAAIK